MALTRAFKRNQKAQLAANRFEYFVTVGVMTEDCNPFGHSFMMISTIDNAQGDNAKVEILDAVGLYSRYMPVLGFKPYTPQGRVKAESPKDLVNKNGLYHQTFKITQEEMATLLTAVNTDRRNTGDEPPVINDKGQKEYRPGGPVFNLFTGENCKRYALEKLESLGINVKNMHGFLEIPKLSHDVHPLKITESKRDGQVVYCWDNPLTLHPRKAKLSTLEKSRVETGQQFLALMQGIDKISTKLEERIAILNSQGRKVKEITTALSKMQQKKSELEKTQPFPNKIDPIKIQTWGKEVGNIVTECTNVLKQKGCEIDFVHALLDTLAEMYYTIRHAVLGKFIATTKSSPNSKDLAVLHEVDKIQSRMQRMKL